MPTYLMTGQSFEAVLFDFWLSLTKVLSIIDLETPQTLKTYDELVANAAEKGSNVVADAYLSEVPLSPAVAAMFLIAMLVHVDGNERGVLESTNLLLLIQSATDPNGAFEQRLVGAVAEIVSDLLSSVSFPERQKFVEVAEHTQRLALRLVDANHDSEALACIQSGANVSVLRLEPVQCIPIVSANLTIALQIGETDAIGMAALRRAQVLLKAAETDANLKLAAFDAVEFAILHPPENQPLREAAIKQLDQLVFSREDFRIQRALLWANLRPDERWPVPKEAQQYIDEFALTVPQNWQGSSDLWMSAMAGPQRLGAQWWMEVENTRLKLDQRDFSALTPSATWGSWSFEHPSLLRAVPHSSSLLREKNLNDFLLTLSHEVTHVFTMAGPIGVANAAMRWALFEIELDLWTLGFKILGSQKGSSEEEFTKEFFENTEISEEEFTKEFFENTEISRLAWWKSDMDDLAAARLIRVQQGLELARKIQLLEDTWAPWFEGLAIYGEAADPLLDKAAYTDVTRLISQLVDYVPEDPETQDRSASVMNSWLERSEKLQAVAIQGAGRYRLRAHIDTHHKRYLAGYLAVRAVVADWRQKIPLTGGEAFRILLFVTRYSQITDVLPDITKPVETFEKEVGESYFRWLTALSAACIDDLKQLLAVSPLDQITWHYWSDGRLAQAKGQEDESRLTTTIENVVRSALESTYRNFGARQRLPEASERCVHVVEVLAEQRSSIAPNFLTKDRIRAVLQPNWILPLAHVQAPFWIVDNMLACLIRTTESGASGEPSYDFTAFTLPEKELREIVQQAPKQPTRRIEIFRVADLANSFNLAERGIGRNLMAFRLGSWVHVQPRGLLFGSLHVDSGLEKDIRARIAPNVVVQTQERLVGDLTKYATRANQWLSKFSPAAKDNPFQVDLSAWLEDIRLLGQHVAQRVPGLGTETVSIDCLAFALGNRENAIRLQAIGFEPMRQRVGSRLGEFMDVVLRSGQAPIQEDCAEWASIAFETMGISLQNQGSGWDLSHPAAMKEVYDAGNGRTQSAIA